MKTVASPVAVTEDDRGFVCSRGNQDGTVTLFYPGDILPTFLPPPQCTAISPRQLRQALSIMGLREMIEQSMATAPQAVRDWYEYAERIESTHPILRGMAAQFGFTELQVQAVFELGASM